jgi:hypothetical protein
LNRPERFGVRAVLPMIGAFTSVSMARRAPVRVFRGGHLSGFEPRLLPAACVLAGCKAAEVVKDELIK